MELKERKDSLKHYYNLVRGRDLEEDENVNLMQYLEDKLSMKIFFDAVDVELWEII